MPRWLTWVFIFATIFLWLFIVVDEKMEAPNIVMSGIVYMAFIIYVARNMTKKAREQATDEDFYYEPIGELNLHLASALKEKRELCDHYITHFISCTYCLAVIERDRALLTRLKLRESDKKLLESALPKLDNKKPQ